MPVPDEMTQLLRCHIDGWRNIAGLSDAELADLIRQDKIDILVDLTMHMAHNRLLVFARKPAPVQVTYLAYCSTTGLATIDYRLSDPYLDPFDASGRSGRAAGRRRIVLQRADDSPAGDLLVLSADHRHAADVGPCLPCSRAASPSAA